MNSLEIERKLEQLTRPNQVKPAEGTKKWRIGFRDGLCWTINASPLDYPFPWEKSGWRNGGEKLDTIRER